MAEDWDDIQASNPTYFPQIDGKPAPDLTRSPSFWSKLLGWLKSGWPADMNAGGFKLLNSGGVTAKNGAVLILGSDASTRGITRIYNAVANQGRIDITQNVSFDGVNWNRDDVANAALQMLMQPASGLVYWRYAPAGANPVGAYPGTATGFRIPFSFDVASGSFQIATQVAPSSNPGTDAFYIYVDPADHKLKARGSSGTITVLANP